MELNPLYASYGFLKLPCEIAKVNVYSLQTGHFHNADIVALSDYADVETAKKQFEEIGYACTIRRYLTIREADESLFQGFFGAESSRKRLDSEYDRFCQALTNRLGAKYQYVAARYEANIDCDSEIVPVVDALTKMFENDGPALIILEAAAGYGKTCTAYEILHSLLQNFNGKIPILTELSRNRQAKIFKYVLLDEVNRNFVGIRLDMVKEQIRLGRIPVIVDGFDELLHRKNELEDSFEDAEPMLETIGALLHNQAKVLLTTRRTAIFTDNAFFEWLNKLSNKFNVINVKLEKPTIEDWLGYEKTRELEENNIPIKHLANPVLLAHLKYIDRTHFLEFCQDPKKIVYSYFETMLEREQNRQELQMTVDEQLSVFRNLANNMIKEDFTSESREYIQLLIQIENEASLNSIRLRYSRDVRPSVDELATKLSHHALLDRRGGDDYRIGFVNDFILGTFTGEIISADNSEKWFSSEQFIDLAVTAYVPRSVPEKDLLWKNLNHVMEYMEKSEQIKIDLMLTSRLNHDLKDGAISGIEFDECALGTDKYIQNIIFMNCIFTHVIVSNAKMENVTFINCKFFNCKIDLFHQENVNITFVACHGDDDSLQWLHLLSSAESQPVEKEDILNDCMKSVLERFWPKGRSSYEGRKALRTLYYGASKSQHNQISNAIEELRKRKLIKIFSTYAELNNDSLGQIKDILGRG
jgi:hypothetical protein